jgi:hypothetical protein
MKNSLILWLCCLPLGLWAQKAGGYKSSGTVFTEEVKAFFLGKLDRIAAYDDSTSRGMVDVPVKIHIVCKSDGTGGVTLPEIKESMSALNEHFSKAYLRFVLLDDYSRILNDDFYKMKQENEEALVKGYEQKNVINLYIVSAISHSRGSCCGYTYPPGMKGGKDRIFITQRCFKGVLSLVRQFGHYYGLYPTQGVEEKRTGELVEGSNCQTEGDQICDTPADPGLNGQNVNERCVYTGSFQDGNGKYYRPPVTNFMSDNPRPECVNQFTRQQYRRLMWTASEVRNYLVFPKTGFTNKELKNMQEKNGLESQVGFMVNSQKSSFYLNKNLYQMTSKTSAGDLWKVSITNPKKLHIYVFEGDTLRQTILRYPQAKEAQFGKDFSLPLQGEGFSLEANAAPKQICILFSKRPLNADQNLKKLNAEEMNKWPLQRRIYRLYDQEILPSRDISYDAEQLKFSAVALGDAYIVPIFIEIKAP